MSGATAIEWTDRTWNPLTGCTKVSAGCDHCYAKTMHERFNGPGSFDTVTLHPERLGQPLSWRKPSMVFVNSMSDLFHKDVPDEFIAQVWAIMALSRHTFQVLTKRPARMRSLLSSQDFNDEFRRLVRATNASVCPDPGVPVQNVWLGVSVESQQWADIRIPALLDTPAAVRFLSCEPLLGPVSLRWPAWQPISETSWNNEYDGLRRIDWVIVGGESGPGARPMHPGWAMSIRDQCHAARVPFLFKQHGAWTANHAGLRGGCERKPDAWMTVAGDVAPEPDWALASSWLAMHRVGKHAAGRMLGGRTWDQYPAVTS